MKTITCTWKLAMCIIMILDVLTLSSCNNDENENNESGKSTTGWAPETLEDHELLFYYGDGTLNFKMFVSDGTPIFYIQNAAQILPNPKPSFNYQKTGKNTAKLYVNVLFTNLAGYGSGYVLEMNLDFSSPKNGTFTGKGNDPNGNMKNISGSFIMDEEGEDGDEINDDEAIVFQNLSISEPLGSEVQISVKVLNDGDKEMTDWGICWSTTSNPKITDNKQSCGKKEGEKDIKLSLSKEGTYYIRPYAIYNNKTYYGDEKSFIIQPELTNINFSNCSVYDIKGTSAEVSGMITFDGKMSERGFCWSTSPNPIIELNQKKACGRDSGPISAVISSLKGNTLYYLRQYAIYNEKVFYGSDVQFNTLEIQDEPSIPIEQYQNLKITEISIDYTTISLRWKYDPAGLNYNNQLTQWGVCWSKQPNPTIYGNSTPPGYTDKNEGLQQITKLEKGTTYYVRMYGMKKNKEVVYYKEYELQTIGSDIKLSFTMNGTTAVINYEINKDGLFELSTTGRYTNYGPMINIYPETLKRGKGTIKMLGSYILGCSVELKDILNDIHYVVYSFQQ